MKSKDLIFIGVMVAVVGIFIFLSEIGQKPKTLTARPEHAGFTDRTPRETCLICHAPDSKVAPMPVRHPKKGKPPDKMPCFACHKPPPAAAASHVKDGTEGDFAWLSQQAR
ncbi:MAG TPA: hypothetical protein VJX67_00995 [Blastocatellia bacterium]|nr:hypothetical protein [Blastocatellia bacterium]